MELTAARKSPQSRRTEHNEVAVYGKQISTSAWLNKIDPWMWILMWVRCGSVRQPWKSTARLIKPQLTAWVQDRTQTEEISVVSYVLVKTLKLWRTSYKRDRRFTGNTSIVNKRIGSRIFEICLLTNDSTKKQNACCCSLVDASQSRSICGANNWFRLIPALFPFDGTSC